MNLLVIDVGTSSMRGVLMDGLGKTLHIHQVEYEATYASGTIVEQAPEQWEATLYAICADASAYGREQGISIDGLSMSCHRSCVVAVDKDGAPLLSAIMWQDKRNASIVEEFRQYEDHISRRTGAHLNTVFSGTKMTWIRRNRPDIYEKAHKLLTAADFLTYVITGQFRTDHTYGSRSMLMDIRTRQWDPELLELFEVEPEKLCELVAPGSVIGHTTEDFARRAGLPSGLPLISAGGDQQCAAIGHGVIGTGSMEITTGTGAFILGFCDEVPDPLYPDVICGAHAVPGKYVLESSMLTCAALYNWLYRNFYDDGTPGRKFDRMNANVLASPPGCNGCIALPYFQGRGTPDWNSSAKGGFLNVTLNTSLADMTRAILEAICYEACNNVEMLERYAGQARKIYIGGGLTHFPEFCQIQSDVYQKELLHSTDSEQTVLGAWASAAVTLGAYSSYEEALTAARKDTVFETYRPNPENAAVYAARRAQMNDIYKKLYQ